MTLNLSWITERLAIGGSFLPTQCHLLREHRIAAVVDLRGEACDDERLLAQHAIELLHLPTIDLCAVSAAALTSGVAFVDGHVAAGRRVLVHCAYGIGRSALLGLCVLVEHGHAPLEALRLAKARRACVSPNRAQFASWAAWLDAKRAASRATWAVPTFDEFRAIAYRPRA